MLAAAALPTAFGGLAGPSTVNDALNASLLEWRAGYERSSRRHRAPEATIRRRPQVLAQCGIVHVAANYSTEQIYSLLQTLAKHWRRTLPTASEHCPGGIQLGVWTDSPAFANSSAAAQYDVVGDLPRAADVLRYFCPTLASNSERHLRETCRTIPAEDAAGDDGDDGASDGRAVVWAQRIAAWRAAPWAMTLLVDLDAVPCSAAVVDAFFGPLAAGAADLVSVLERPLPHGNGGPLWPEPAEAVDPPCADAGPWPCTEAGCPGDGRVDCAHLMPACALRPSKVWEAPPPQIDATKHIYELCPLSCGHCPYAASASGGALQEAFHSFGERNLGSLALRTGAAAAADALALLAEVYRWQVVGAGARPPRYGLVGDQAAWRTVLAFSVPTGRLREHVVGDEVCYGRLAEPQPPCALAHSGNAAERLRWTQAGLCDGAPEAWRVAPPLERPV